MPFDRDVHRQVAELHVTCLDQGFLSSLGPAILTQLYRAIDESDDSVLLIETDGDKVIGFVCGSAGMGPVYRQMLRHPLALGGAGFPLLFKPTKVLGILEILRHGSKKSERSALPDHELLSIALLPAARGSGRAADLYNRLADHFRSRNIEAFRIVVGDTLAPAHRFYQKMGATVAEKVQVHAGKESTIYVQHL
jgi:GNAT superfamily N-acetyltransferase